MIIHLDRGVACRSCSNPKKMLLFRYLCQDSCWLNPSQDPWAHTHIYIHTQSMYQSMYAYIGYGVINHQHIPQQVLDSAPATDVSDVSYVHSWGYIMGIYCNGGITTGLLNLLIVGRFTHIFHFQPIRKYVWWLHSPKLWLHDFSVETETNSHMFFSGAPCFDGYGDHEWAPFNRTFWDPQYHVHVASELWLE